MAWFILLVAGLLEVGWAIGLKYTEGFTRPLPSGGDQLRNDDKILQTALFYRAMLVQVPELLP